ncbi:DUF3422 family protein [Herbaspirillum huttiense]|jgi:uncharacterized membrane-anchored protein|uniref:DUF3422 domain-containing protein n=2 Tax=Herbaspirillum huttiense TaxID=863372 RepID=A0AAJ2H6D2_9BURK|nr:DUF3422 domain-containing protein [Herbaspirillum huttiense]MBN9356681.1 DUF3422 domain-containing protein [Herbaspirillum huttiense]MDR9834415.1 DUF3422 domain-containing protein [Herbaspirillum huttiense]UWE18673.1 DUF3422 domain-containing protein [Herbaspirillum huttiense]
MSIVFASLNHPQRVVLAAEVHSRPFLQLTRSETLTHLAVYVREDGNGGRHASAQHVLLDELCAHFGVVAPGGEAKHFYHDFGRFRLKWECHTEFATYTFAQAHEEELGTDQAFARAPLAHIPQQWLLGLKGKLMVAAHVVVEPGADDTAATARQMQRIFEGKLMSSSKVLQGGEIWTDFQIQSDGFSRFVVRDIGLRELQGGRLAQRILEIETYRMMALLGLPHAQQSGPLLNEIEGDLAALTAAMVQSEQSTSGTPEEMAEDERILRKITGLAARIEKLSLENSYRFSASQAYFRLVQARIEELREQRIEGVPTIGEFMERRLAPAMNTCQAIARRQEALAERIAHTNDLLRTRIGIVQERQNRQILESMNARAAQQLKLQQAVEGLSVAAISYYVIGLLGYAGKAAKAAGLPINPDLATGLVVPVVAACVWLGLRRMHKDLGNH